MTVNRVPKITPRRHWRTHYKSVRTRRFKCNDCETLFVGVNAFEQRLCEPCQKVRRQATVYDAERDGPDMIPVNLRVAYGL